MLRSKNNKVVSASIEPSISTPNMQHIPSERPGSKFKSLTFDLISWPRCVFSSNFFYPAFLFLRFGRMDRVVSLPEEDCFLRVGLPGGGPFLEPVFGEAQLKGLDTAPAISQIKDCYIFVGPQIITFCSGAAESGKAGNGSDQGSNHELEGSRAPFPPPPCDFTFKVSCVLGVSRQGQTLGGGVLHCAPPSELITLT